MKIATARLLVGRTITGFAPNPFPDGRGGTTYAPVITLDNGAELTFEVRETEQQIYGVNPEYSPKR